MAEDETGEAGGRPAVQDYVVMIQIGGAGDAEVYLPGSLIQLSDERAMAHLAAGNVRPLDHTDAPVEEESEQVVHSAESQAAAAPAAKSHKKAKSSPEKDSS